MVEVAVKKMEWFEEHRDGEYVRYGAMTLIGGYEASTGFPVKIGGCVRRHPPSWKGPWSNVADPVKSIDEAKAAAQADFEARLRSCLSTPPEGKQETVAKRWLVEQHLPSGTIQWGCYEHERHARQVSASWSRDVGGFGELASMVTPLFASQPDQSAEIAQWRGAAKNWEGLWEIRRDGEDEAITRAERVEAENADLKAKLGSISERVAWRDVLDERQRQISAEGWTPEHDDAHDKGELVAAAICYAQPHNHYVPLPEPVRFQAVADAAKDARESLVTLREWAKARAAENVGKPARSWPWHADWWKPGGARRDLVRSAALLIAEIERLDRTALSHPGDQDEAPRAETGAGR